MSDAEIYDINHMRVVQRLSRKERIAKEFAGVMNFPIPQRPVPQEAPVDISMHFSPESYTSASKERLKNFGDVVMAHVGAFAWQEMLENELRILKEGE